MLLDRIPNVNELTKPEAGGPDAIILIGLD
jgi:hypothetical protein